MMQFKVKAHGGPRTRTMKLAEFAVEIDAHVYASQMKRTHPTWQVWMESRNQRIKGFNHVKVAR